MSAEAAAPRLRGNRLLKLLDRVIGRAVIFALAGLLRLGLLARRAAPGGDPERILVVKLAALGDTILLVPALRRLRERFPRARIVVVGTAINAAVLELFPGYVSELVRLDTARFARSPRYVLRFVRALRRERFDLALDFEQWSNATAILVALSGAPVRAGFRLEGSARHRLYTEAYERPAGAHEADIFLGLLERAGVAGADPRLELPVEPARVEAVRRALEARGFRAGRPLVVIHPGCGAHGFPREWPVERWARVIEALRAERRAFFAITGTPGEAPLVGALEAAAGPDGAALTGAPLPDFIALASMADLFLSGNNGAMHVAAAVGAPQVALHGPTNAARWGPRSARATVVRSRCPGCPCLDLGFEYHRTDGFCMSEVPLEEVLRAARDRLDAGRGAA